jgi:predicted transcriptional regulator
MSYEISNTVQSMISQRMATGIYVSEEQLLVLALNKLDDYEQTIADIKAGMDDERAGRMRSLSEVDRDLRKELGFPTNG